VVLSEGRSTLEYKIETAWPPSSPESIISFMISRTEGADCGRGMEIWQPREHGDSQC
jgi:hypothetical protein